MFSNTVDGKITHIVDYHYLLGLYSIVRKAEEGSVEGVSVERSLDN